MSLDVYLHNRVKCPHCGEMVETVEELFWANITHNLNKMAEEAGMYKHLWHPGELGIQSASEMIEPIQAGLSLMRADPERFRKFDAQNGWGTYDQFVPWIETYLQACINYPHAGVCANG